MGERRQGAENPGIGDENVELAPALVEGGAEPIERVEILDVDGDQRGGRASGLDGVVQLFERALGAGQRHDMGAGFGKRDGGGTADAARGAGDERDPAGEWF